MKPYRCRTCAKTFANSSYLWQHERIHSNSKPYKCKTCDATFRQHAHLQQHIRTHTGEKPYRCQHQGCTKAYSQLCNLQFHSRVHVDPNSQPYKCRSCYRCFRDEASLESHILKHLDTKRKKRHICRKCGQAYAREQLLIHHMLSKHKTATGNLGSGYDVLKSGDINSAFQIYSGSGHGISIAVSASGVGALASDGAVTPITAETRTNNQTGSCPGTEAAPSRLFPPMPGLEPILHDFPHPGLALGVDLRSHMAGFRGRAPFMPMLAAGFPGLAGSGPNPFLGGLHPALPNREMEAGLMQSPVQLPHRNMEATMSPPLFAVPSTTKPRGPSPVNLSLLSPARSTPGADDLDTLSVKSESPLLFKPHSHRDSRPLSPDGHHEVLDPKSTPTPSPGGHSSASTPPATTLLQPLPRGDDFSQTFRPLVPGSWPEVPWGGLTSARQLPALLPFPGGFPHRVGGGCQPGSALLCGQDDPRPCACREDSAGQHRMLQNTLVYLNAVQSQLVRLITGQACERDALGGGFRN